MLKTDEQLMEEFTAGNAGAFDQLLERWRSPMYSFVLGILKNGEAADDAFQEVFVRVIRGAKSFETDRKFSSWAFRIANNICMDILRKNSRAATESEPDVPAPDPAPGPEERLEKSETARRLRAHILSLPVDQRRVLILREYAGLSFREIADVLDCPLNTALGRMRDALKKLSPLMEADEYG